MIETAAQSPMPVISTGTGHVDTLAGWASLDPEVAEIAPWFRTNLGVIGEQFMDRAALDARIAALPPAPEPPVETAAVADGETVVVHDLADDPVLGSPGVATVVDGALTKVNLTV